MLRKTASRSACVKIAPCARRGGGAAHRITRESELRAGLRGRARLLPGLRHHPQRVEVHLLERLERLDVRLLRLDDLLERLEPVRLRRRARRVRRRAARRELRAPRIARAANCAPRNCAAYGALLRLLPRLLGRRLLLAQLRLRRRRLAHVLDGVEPRARQPPHVHVLLGRVDVVVAADRLGRRVPRERHRRRRRILRLLVRDVVLARRHRGRRRRRRRRGRRRVRRLARRQRVRRYRPLGLLRVLVVVVEAAARVVGVPEPAVLHLHEGRLRRRGRRVGRRRIGR